MNDGSHLDARELKLLALRYVTGELSVEACDRFEARLAHDLAAAEAVAEAVHFVECVAAAEAADVERSRADRRAAWLDRAAVLIAIAGSVCVAAVGGYQWLATSGPTPPAENPVRNVALVWAEMHDVVASDLTAESVVGEADAVLDERTWGDLDVGDLIGEEPWIVDAVGEMTAAGGSQRQGEQEW